MAKRDKGVNEGHQNIWLYRLREAYKDLPWDDRTLWNQWAPFRGIVNDIRVSIDYIISSTPQC